MKRYLYSITRWFLYGLLAITVVVFLLFFVAGEPLVLVQESEGTGEVTELPYPQFMELSLYLCYAMGAITLLLVAIFETIAVVKKIAYEPKSGIKIGLAILLVVLVALGFYLAPDKIDYVIYLQYALLGIAALSMLSSFFISKIRS
jgi:hypothetical protein